MGLRAWEGCFLGMAVAVAAAAQGTRASGEHAPIHVQMFRILVCHHNQKSVVRSLVVLRHSEVSADYGD